LERACNIFVAETLSEILGTEWMPFPFEKNFHLSLKGKEKKTREEGEISNKVAKEISSRKRH